MQHCYFNIQLCQACKDLHKDKFPNSYVQLFCGHTVCLYCLIQQSTKDSFEVCPICKDPLERFVLSVKRSIQLYHQKLIKYQEIYHQVSKQDLLKETESLIQMMFHGVDKALLEGKKVVQKYTTYLIEQAYQVDSQLKQIQILEGRFYNSHDSTLGEEIMQKISKYEQYFNNFTKEKRKEEIVLLKCKIFKIVKKVVAYIFKIQKERKRIQAFKKPYDRTLTIYQDNERSILVDFFNLMHVQEIRAVQEESANKIKKATIIIPHSSSPTNVSVIIDQILKEQFKKITEIDLNLSFFTYKTALELIRGIQIQGSFKNIRKLILTLPLQYYDHVQQTLSFDKHIDLLFEISDLEIEFVNFDYPIHNYQEFSELPTNYSLPFALTLNLSQNKKVRMEELKNLVKQFKLLPIYRLKVNIQGCNIDEVEFKQFLKENSGKKKGGPAIKMYLVKNK